MNTIDTRVLDVELCLQSNNKQIPAFLFGVVLIAGGKSVSIQSPRPSANPPTKTDPIRLASATIQAVDRIGEATSEEIDITADEIMRGATEIAEKLQEFFPLKGWLEIGHTQKEELLSLFKNYNIEFQKDYSGVYRFLIIS